MLILVVFLRVLSQGSCSVSCAPGVNWRVFVALWCVPDLFSTLIRVNSGSDPLAPVVALTARRPKSMASHVILFALLHRH